MYEFLRRSGHKKIKAEGVERGVDGEDDPKVHDTASNSSTRTICQKEKKRTSLDQDLKK